MKFRLTYNGRLKSRSSATKEDKHEIRKKLHPQLRALWSRDPLAGRGAHLTDPNAVVPEGQVSLIERVGAFAFVPLASRTWFTVADVDVLFLRRSPPGQLVGHGGDIDNRMKTLLDALRVPNAAELPSGAAPGKDEEPFYCLLQDDALVTTLSIRADEWLEQGDPRDVLLIIHVDVRPRRAIWATVGL
jgi:hypothetical protein